MQKLEQEEEEEHEEEQSKEYRNFIKAIESPVTKKSYKYCISGFLDYCKLDLHKFLKLPQEKITDLVINYLVQKKVGRQYKGVIFFTIKHACEVNDVLLNWKKIKKFTKSSKTGNELTGNDRGYTHEELQKILEFSDQRVRTAFLILASTGIRIGSLTSMKVGDLERINDLYKVNVYSDSDNENDRYGTFTTPEASKEIDAYLEFRKRRGENITSDSFLIVQKFSFSQKGTSKSFKGRSLNALLEDYINNSGLRVVDHNNKFKRKDVPLLHGTRRFFTKQLVDSKINPEIREMLLGHKIGLTGAYYKPTEQEMLDEYYKAVPLLTISNEERLKFKLEERIQIEKTTIQRMQEKMDEFSAEIQALKSKKRK